VRNLSLPFSYLPKAFRTRSFAKSPGLTVARGVAYTVLSRSGARTTFAIPFGDVSFKMWLQNAGPHFGIANIYLQRKYYESLLEFGHKLIDPGSVAVDGGASQGLYTCAFAAKVGSSGQVYAFEPFPRSLDCLRKNLALNGFRNVTLFEGALSRNPGHAFLDTQKGPVYASITPFPVSKGLQVATFGIDELRRQRKMSAIQFLKLDIEGAELAALEGARETLLQDKPNLCVEANTELALQQLTDFLAQFRLKPFLFDDHGALMRLERTAPNANVFYLH
jgi:FkbM family methyltransferase